jgi:uncharacterized membrane protein YgcG
MDIDSVLGLSTPPQSPLSGDESLPLPVAGVNELDRLFGPDSPSSTASPPSPSSSPSPSPSSTSPASPSPASPSPATKKSRNDETEEGPAGDEGPTGDEEMEVTIALAGADHHTLLGSLVAAAVIIVNSEFLEACLPETMQGDMWRHPNASQLVVEAVETCVPPKLRTVDLQSHGSTRMIVVTPGEQRELVAIVAVFEMTAADVNARTSDSLEGARQHAKDAVMQQLSISLRKVSSMAGRAFAMREPNEATESDMETWGEGEWLSFHVAHEYRTSALANSLSTFSTEEKPWVVWLPAGCVKIEICNPRREAAKLRARQKRALAQVAHAQELENESSVHPPAPSDESKEGELVAAPAKKARAPRQKAAKSDSAAPKRVRKTKADRLREAFGDVDEDGAEEVGADDVGDAGEGGGGDGDGAGVDEGGGAVEGGGADEGGGAGETEVRGKRPMLMARKRAKRATGDAIMRPIVQGSSDDAATVQFVRTYMHHPKRREIVREMALRDLNMSG